MYYLKGIVSVCFRCPARTGFLWNTPVLVHLQPTKLSDTQALPTPWLGRSTRGLQPGGHVHKEALHLISLQPTSITSSGAFKPECNGLSQFREDTGGPSIMPVRVFDKQMDGRTDSFLVARPRCTQCMQRGKNRSIFVLLI